MSNQENNLGNFHQVGGILHHIADTENKSKKAGKSFYIREFVLEIRATKGDRTFTSFAKFELKGDDYVKKVDTFEIGDPVVVTYVLDGRKWSPKDEDKVVYFNSLKCLNVSQMPEALRGEYVKKEEDAVDIAFRADEIDAGKHIVPGLLGDDRLVDDGVDDLPFILTIPIAIGTLMGLSQYIIF